MPRKYCCLFALYLFMVLETVTVTGRSRFRSELSLIHCLCETSTWYRMGKIQCMDRFVPEGHTYTMSQSLQYCGYFVNKTNFGQTVRKRIYLKYYNPWEPAPDLNTDIICGYTRIRPGNAAPPNIWYVTSKGWVISKCVLNMARMDPIRADYMIKRCMPGCQDKYRNSTLPDVVCLAHFISIKLCNLPNSFLITALVLFIVKCSVYRSGIGNLVAVVCQTNLPM